jgi:hypothetical protein
MAFITALAGLALIFVMLMEGFEAMVWPRRVTRQYRFTRLFYRYTWMAWVAFARWLFAPGKRRETYLSLFGPLSLLTIFALWVSGIIIGFGILHWSLATALNRTEAPVDLPTYLYFSGQTFFTLGFGEVTPVYGLGRFLAVFESGMGFGFMALIIGYLPVLYQAFSIAPAAGELSTHFRPRSVYGRVGTVGGRDPRKPPLLSCPELLSLAT